jgi:Ca-activated chloride channel homolog
VRRVTALCLALTATLPPAAFGRQKYRSGVDVVRVDVLATENRKPIAGLTAADFELRDNGVVQDVASADLESLPVSAILVLDTSGSVAGTKMWHLSQAVDLLLNGLREGDRAALITFSHRVWLRTPLTSDFRELHTLLAGAEAQGGTALYDALYAGLALSDVEDARPLVVAFSDGLDNMSWMSAGNVEKAARRANAVVYGVAVAASATWSFKPDYVKGQTTFLDHVATSTGGRVIKADTIGNLPAAFDDIVREFRTRYLLTYSPRGVDRPGWHNISVRVKGRNAEVRARAGYQK